MIETDMCADMGKNAGNWARERETLRKRLYRGKRETQRVMGVAELEGVT